MNLKQNKGIGLADTIIAIAIFIIFTGLVVNISYNIYLQSNFVKRNSNATSYIVDLFEYAQTLAFDEITEQNLNVYINSKDIATGYNFNIIVTKVPEDAEYEYIKKIDATVTYNLGRKTKTLSMSTLINK